MVRGHGARLCPSIAHLLLFVVGISYLLSVSLIKAFIHVSTVSITAWSPADSPGGLLLPVCCSPSAPRRLALWASTELAMERVSVSRSRRWRSASTPSTSASSAARCGAAAAPGCGSPDCSCAVACSQTAQAISFQHLWLRYRRRSHIGDMSCWHRRVGCSLVAAWGATCAFSGAAVRCRSSLVAGRADSFLISCWLDTCLAAGWQSSPAPLSIGLSF
jgi:hypothetical protein